MKKLICSLLFPISLFTQGQGLYDLSNDSDLQTNNSNIPIAIELPQGWSMFGYTCIDSIDALIGFAEIADKIEIVKDEWGMSYIPSWEFNALGSLQFSEGYQINMTQEVIGFQFCDAIIPEDGITQADVDSAYANGVASVTPEDGITQADVDAAHASYIGWCESDVDNDGICDVDEVSGCMDSSYCNYNLEAEFDDGSCYDNDLGCGCDNPAAQEGYDCDGNELPIYQVGTVTPDGGKVFYIDSAYIYIVDSTDISLRTERGFCLNADNAGGQDASNNDDKFTHLDYLFGGGYANTLQLIDVALVDTSGIYTPLSFIHVN